MREFQKFFLQPFKYIYIYRYICIIRQYGWQESFYQKRADNSACVFSTWLVSVGISIIVLEPFKYIYIYICTVLKAFRPPVLCVFFACSMHSPRSVHQLCICTWWGPIRRSILDIHEWSCLAMHVTSCILWGVQNQEALQIHIGLCDWIQTGAGR